MAIIPAAHRFDQYLHILRGKRVGMVVNQTSVVGNTYLIDTLLSRKVNIAKIFSPEHGFRGKADAGELQDNYVDTQTGIQVVSIYGKKLKPDSVDLKDIDIVVFDIQDLGARFYTFISTLQKVMESCAENRVPLMILDRPNPLGYYVDGPVLKDTSLKSFVGMQPVPTVYGMTEAEYALMLNGEGWLDHSLKCELTIIKCAHYKHHSVYQLPIKPSPNIPNMRAVYLYPSLCLFEGTNVSIGRGTNKQFQVYGCPDFEGGTARFTPQPNEGAKAPPFMGVECVGFDLSATPIKALQKQKKINLGPLLDFYTHYTLKDSFFFNGGAFFDKLAGTKLLRHQIKEGLSEQAIRQSWEPDLAEFKKIRQRYLLYK